MPCEMADIEIVHRSNRSYFVPIDNRLVVVPLQMRSGIQSESSCMNYVIVLFFSHTRTLAQTQIDATNEKKKMVFISFSIHCHRFAGWCVAFCRFDDCLLALLFPSKNGRKKIWLRLRPLWEPDLLHFMGCILIIMEFRRWFQCCFCSLLLLLWSSILAINNSSGKIFVRFLTGSFFHQ